MPKKNKSMNNWLEANVEEKYSKKGELEHILELPDTHIGSTELEDYNFWVPDDMDGDVSFSKQDIRFTPGLYKIIDEILVNAYDQAVRLKEIARKVSGREEPDEEDLKETGIDFVKSIKIDINQDEGYLSVCNDGEGIDVAVHPVHKVYVPQMIFGDMRTSSNYNKVETGIQIVGGRNGFGAKLANIFSKKFIVETVDARRKLHFVQEYGENMNVRNEPVVKKTSKKAFTKITFYPDLARFGYEGGMDDNIYRLVLKRAYDLAACTEPSITVYLNNEKIDCKTFEKYVSYYLGNKSSYPRVYKKFNSRWEVVACCSPNQKFDQVSFANGVSTIRGGKHIEYISKQIVTKLKTYIQNKKKITNLKSEHVKDNIMVFVKCSINNASFDTQTKECLTLASSKFGSSCVIDDSFIETLANKCGVLDQVVSWHEMKSELNLKKTDGSNRRNHLNIPKLDDAGWAGSGKNAQKACLILTEGDSAKTLAMAGRSAVTDEKGHPIGHKKFGVFPMRGKVLNVDGASAEKIVNNQEITYLKQILGLQEGKNYKDTKTLRYGSIMIMADQDSVTGDTPLLLQNTNGYYDIKTIDSLTTNWQYDVNGKEYGKTDMKIWTEKGWTNIKHVMRHKVTKKIYRVLTNTGIVDVTEDHSLLNEYGAKVSPNQCQVGNTLLHSFPKFNETNTIKTNLLENEAWLLGSYWKYDNDNNKYNPYEILNSSNSVRQQFFEGLTYDCNKYSDGNGYSHITVEVNNKVMAQTVYLLSKSLGYNVYLNHENSYTLTITDRYYTGQTAIKQIIDLGTTQQYVYDLETENHHFQAGIGQMIVHNTDGSHIKGLIMNIFKTKWPSLFEMDGFITSLLTPIIKIYKGSDSKKKNVKSFYSIPQFEKWKVKNNDAKGWNIKYYKGLGTSTSKEGKEYFKEFKQNIYTIMEKEDAYDAIGLAFDKSRADDRKEWLQIYDGDAILDYSKVNIPYRDFVDKDLKHFSHSDNRRSIPCILDGFKESQRKILFGAEKKKIAKEIKVAQLAAYIAEHTAYHHGETSLTMTICSMAHNFVGSNNINMFVPIGQFGSRLQGGKDSASPRYIFTRLEQLTKIIFNEKDKPLYTYIDEDGQSIEPESYVPIIPMILVNGSKGIGTGYSTSVPCFNPKDIIRGIRKLINGESIQNFTPWYRGFKGYITKSGPNSYMTRGIYNVIDNKIVEITELPIGVWTANYKDYLLKLAGEKVVTKSPKAKKNPEQEEKKTKVPRLLKKIEEAHTDTTVKFTLYFENDVLETLLSGPPDKRGINLFEKTFKLTSSISINNMTLYDSNNCLKKYKNTVEIMEEFYDVRQEFYEKRRKHMLAQLKQDKMRLSWKAKFILAVISDDESEKVHVNKRSKKNIYDQLEKKKYPKEINGKLVKLSNIENIEDEDANKAYNYLLSMPIYNLTEELIQKLVDDKDKKEAEYNILKEKTHLQLWEEDLDDLEKAYDAYCKNYWKDNKSAESEYLDAMKKKSKKKTLLKAKMKSGIETDEEQEEQEGQEDQEE